MNTTTPYMETGKIFHRDKAFWMAETVTIDQNKGFVWLVVTAVWSGFGSRPIWATEPRTFIMNRKAK